jgi:secretion/DNA translocation related TadE-like protein
MMKEGHMKVNDIFRAVEARVTLLAVDESGMSTVEYAIGTIAAAAFAAVLYTVVTGGSAYLGAAVVARHRAQAAADLAALAAAARVTAGPESACRQANAVARAMRVSAADCVVDDLDVVVTVEVGLAAGRWGTARAAARAGPA